MKDIFVGDFTEEDIKNGSARQKKDEAMAEHPDCRYVRSILIRNRSKRVKGAYITRTWVCDYYPD